MGQQLDFARQQIIGFSHAAQGYSIEDLAESMGMTEEEWKELRDDSALTSKMRADLDAHFKEQEDE